MFDNKNGFSYTPAAFDCTAITTICAKINDKVCKNKQLNTTLSVRILYSLTDGRVGFDFRVVTTTHTECSDTH